MDNTNDTLDERWVHPSSAASAAASTTTNNNKRKAIPWNRERRMPKQNVRSLIRDSADHIIMPTPSSVASSYRKTQSPTTQSRNRRRGCRENSHSRRNQAVQGDRRGRNSRDDVDEDDRRHLAAESIRNRNKADSSSPRPRWHRNDVPSLSHNSINANDDDDEENDVFIYTRRRESRDRDRRDQMWSTGSNPPQKQKAASQNKACRKGKGSDTSSTTPSHSVVSRKNNSSSTLPSNHRSRQNVHTRFSNSSSDDDDGCREYIERLNRKLGMAQTSSQMDDDNDDEDHTIGTSPSKSIKHDLTDQQLTRICKFEEQHDHNGTKRKSDAVVDLASMPSNRRRRYNSWEIDRGSYNNNSAVHSTTSSFERQNEEYLERINRSVERGGRSREYRKDDTRRNACSRKGAATATASARKSNFRGKHHSPSSFTHCESSTTNRRQRNPQKARFDTLNLRMRHFEDPFDEGSYYKDNKNGSKRQSYNESDIVSTLENKRRTDSVDDRGIDDISAECPRRSRFSDTGRLDEEEAEDDIANCDEPFSPGESQTTTQKRTPPTKGLSDRWESPPSSASPLWSFGVKNHKNVNKQSGT
jgi:hypothetical protein